MLSTYMKRAHPTLRGAAAGLPQSPFEHRIFRAVWIATLLSSFGGMVQGVGAAWMMVAFAAPAHMVTLVQASITLPIVLLALVAGALADAFDRRVLMIVAQTFMLVASATLAMLAYLGLLTPWLLLLFTFLIGSGAALNAPAWQASVAAMVPRDVVPSAIAVNAMGFNLARSLGPALGGLIVAVAGAAAAFAANAISYVGLIVVLIRWRTPNEPRLLPREPLGRAIMSGVRYVAMSPRIKSSIMRGFVTGLGASAVSSLMPLIAQDMGGSGPAAYGLLLGAFGVGAVGGAMLSQRARSVFSNETIVRVALGCSAAGIAILASVPALTTAMVAMMLCGMGWVLIVSILNAIVQMSSPRWVVARALSLYQMATFGGLALGAGLWGGVTERLSVGSALWLAAAVQMMCIFLGRWIPMPGNEEMQLDQVSFDEPATAFAIEGRTGPVVVTIEYRIAAGDLVPFLNIMAERRKIRLKNGARRWSILRDLSENDLWVERYHCPTWVEYLRHNRRFTCDDRDIGRRIKALHQGSSDPVVRRMIERQTGVLPTAGVVRANELVHPDRL